MISNRKNNFINTVLLSVIFIGLSYISYAQPTKHGAKTVTVAVVVNEYTYVVADISAGTKVISVSNAGLNANSRFPSVLAPGDLIMIMQMQGATLTAANDTSWGSVQSYNNCGLYELAQVASVSGSNINLDCPVQNNYKVSGKTQVIRVPRYSSLTVNSGAMMSADAWDGQIGGVLAMEVEGNTLINAGGKLDVSGKGFRGGQNLDNNYDFAVTDFVNGSNGKGAEKGESIAGYKSDYDVYGGRYCRGAPANGGGGGNAHTSGGGGGANAGVINAWNGKGNPDVSNPSWATAWNLESIGFANSTSSGGGRGGYNWSGTNGNPLVYGPSNYGIWGGDSRWNHGGLGGRPLDYTGGRVFMGGGGGSGEQNDSRGGKGGDGGGIIYLVCTGNVSGGGLIMSNGNNGGDSGTGTFSNSGTDACGGAGGGGAILINTKGTVSGVSLTANGGIGGNQKLFLNPFSPPKEAEGPGGGGGGGFIDISNGSPSMQTAGGMNGTTNSPSMNAFPADGATKGGPGIFQKTLSNFKVIPQHANICPGNSANLSITTTGNAPSAGNFIWYDQAVGGNVVGNGLNLTTPVLNATKYYYVGTCPGFRRDTVKAIVHNVVPAKAGNDTSVCKGNTVQLNGFGGIAFLWSPASGLNNPMIAKPIASPNKTTTYTLTVTDINSCTSKDSVKVTVDSVLVVNAGPDQSICSGGTTFFNATALTGATYLWSPATGLSSTSVHNPFANPSVTTQYIFNVTNAGGCKGTDTLVLTVHPLPLANAGNDTSICPGTSASLNASGGVSYSWLPANSLNSSNIPNPIASPTINTTYTLTVTNAEGCKATDMITVNTNAKLNVKAGRDTVLCNGASLLLNASGGTQYTWSPANGLSNINISNPLATPSITTTYIVNVQNSNGCVGADTITISVMPPLSVSAGLNDSICDGASLQLNGSGASNYSWQPTSSLSNPLIANPIANPLSDTYYILTGSDNNGCSKTDTVLIKVLSRLPLSINSGGIHSICFGDSLQFTANTGAAVYSWSPSAGLSDAFIYDPYAKPLVSTLYTLTAVASNSCISTDTIHLNILPLPNADAGSDQLVCNGNGVTLQGSGGVNYLWSPPDGLSSTITANPIATPDTSTTYYLFVNDNFCSNLDSVHLTVVNSEGNIKAGSNAVIYKGSSITLKPWGGTDYFWSPESFLSCQNCENPLAGPRTSMWYYVEATDQNGCRTTDSLYIQVIDGVSVYVPSSFTPNRDDKNDIFYVSGVMINEFSMRIYTRWGNLVFESSDPQIGWDGTHKGDPVKEDTYIYVIHAITEAGGAFDKVGGVTIVR